MDTDDAEMYADFVDDGFHINFATRGKPVPSPRDAETPENSHVGARPQSQFSDYHGLLSSKYGDEEGY